MQVRDILPILKGNKNFFKNEKKFDKEMYRKMYKNLKKRDKAEIKPHIENIINKTWDDKKYFSNFQKNYFILSIIQESLN
jgi:ribosomal protein L19E